MHRIWAIFLLFYYGLGSLFLPGGNLALLPSMHEMYVHCKATEDRDMNLVGFISDHLLNVDCVLDAHLDGDNQHPHKSLPLEHKTFKFISFPLPQNGIYKIPTNNIQIHCITELHPQYSKGIPSDIFRPPIFFLLT